MIIHDIGEAVYKYTAVLSPDEIELGKTFYQITNDLNVTVCIYEEFKNFAYGLATGSIDRKMVDWVNEKIAIAIIIKILHISYKSFQKLPVDVQDALLDCYEENPEKDQLIRKLQEIADINNINDDLENPSSSVIAQEPEHEEKPQAEAPKKHRERPIRDEKQPDTGLLDKMFYLKEATIDKVKRGIQ